MKRIVMIMITGLACIATAFAQTSEERVPTKGFAMFSAQNTGKCRFETCCSASVCRCDNMVAYTFQQCEKRR